MVAGVGPAVTDRDDIRGPYDDVAAEYATARQPDDRELAGLHSLFEGVSAAARVLDAGRGQGEPLLGALRARASTWTLSP